MTADALVSRELKSLQDELSSSRKERLATVAATPAALPEVAEPLAGTAEDQELRDQLGQLADELTNFFGNAEKTIAAHPTESVMGALLAGIVIGRLLGRR